MKKQVLSALLGFMGLSLLSWGLNPSTLLAQSVSVLSTDTSNFPTLATEIQLEGGEKAIESDFQILDEDGTDIPFQLDDLSSSGMGTQGRMVLFLIDASSYTSGPPLQNFKQSILEFLKGGLIQEGDVYNVGYYNNKKDDGSAFRPVENDFSPNVAALRDRVDTKVTSGIEGDSSKAADAFLALTGALEYIVKSPNVGQKMIIFLSAAPDIRNAIYSADEIIEQARAEEIPIHTINYIISRVPNNPEIYRKISGRTNGINFAARSKPEIINAIGDIFDSPILNSNKGLQQYRLIFNTSVQADGIDHQYKINYRSEPPITVSYPAPNRRSPGGGGGFLQDYGLILIVIAGILLGLIYWQYNEMQIRKQEEIEQDEEDRERQEAELRRREGDRDRQVKDLQEKNIRLQEQLRAKEQELAKKIDEIPTVMNPEKFDPKNTIIAGGGAAPVLKVAAGAFRENFYLNKPLITIGRAPNNDIIIPEQTVSSKHATISIQNGSFFLKDLDSTNGTFVNGTRIDQKLLKSGDLIKLGAAQCQFEI